MSMVGEEIVIGHRYARKYLYESCIGCKAIIASETNDGYIVKLHEVLDTKMLPHIGEMFFVHTEDCQPAITKHEDIEQGDVVEVLSNHAKDMGYEDCVGHDGIVEYKGNSYAEVVMITGPEAGERKDIHLHDLLMRYFHQEKKEHHIVVDHDSKTIFYDERPDIIVRISKKLQSNKIVTGKASNISMLIDRYGYTAILAQDSKWAQEAQ